ncbi:hypothetical protein JCM24511_07657 [Saitozyma sp. JCM 24511]|nr:hypothetical protein JCM24511_07657 [Saitozyma sp. JCM 24511]
MPGKKTPFITFTDVSYPLPSPANTPQRTANRAKRSSPIGIAAAHRAQRGQRLLDKSGNTSHPSPKPKTQPTSRPDEDLGLQLARAQGMTRTLKRIIDERQARYNSEIARLKQEQREAMGRLEKDCLREMEEMQEKHRGAMNEKEQSHQRELQALPEQSHRSHGLDDLKPLILDGAGPSCSRPSIPGDRDGETDRETADEENGNKLEVAERALKDQASMIRRLESEVKVLKRSAISGVQLRRDLQRRLREMQEMLNRRAIKENANAGGRRFVLNVMESVNLFEI